MTARLDLRESDGREERMAALMLELRLKRDPEVTRRRKEYHRRVAAARAEAVVIGKNVVIERLIESKPSYIRDLLETEDERFGDGSLYERYARTFYKKF